MWVRESKKAPVCSEGGAHRLVERWKEGEKEKRSQVSQGLAPGTGFHSWRQGSL